MAARAKAVNQKALLSVLKDIGIAATGAIASGMVAKVIDEKVLKVEGSANGVKGLASGLICTGAGAVAAIKAKEAWQKDFAIGFAIAGSYKVVRKAVPKLNLSGLDGGGYYDQYGNYIAGVDEVDGYDEIGLAPISAAVNAPANIDWRGSDYSFQPSLPMISGVEAPASTDGYFNDGTATVPALMGGEETEIL